MATVRPGFGQSVSGIATPQTLPAPPGLVDGDLVVLITYWDAVSTITEPAGFSTPIAYNSTLGFNVFITTKIASSEPASYTITPGGAAFNSGMSIAISGLDASPVDVSWANYGTGTAMTNTSDTTTADALVLGVMTNYNWDPMTDPTVPAGLTIHGSVDSSAIFNTESLKLFHYEQATAGATPISTATVATSQPWGMMMLALKNQVVVPAELTPTLRPAINALNFY